eukprot:g5319.t1
MAEAKHTSQCLCGGVEMELLGRPLASIHCHCMVCQQWTGAPFQWMVLFRANKASVVKGAENIQLSRTSDALDRARCKKCTCHVYNYTPGKMYAIPGVAIQGIRSEDRIFAEGFAPIAEIFYSNRVMDSHGGLPTFDELPVV